MEVQERERFGAVVASFTSLGELDTALFRAGLELAERLELPAVMAAVVEHVASGAFDWSRDDQLSRAVVEQLRRAAMSRSDETLSQALRHAALVAPGSGLILLMAPHDGDGIAEHAVALSQAAPRARARVLAALARDAAPPGE